MQAKNRRDKHDKMLSITTVILLALKARGLTIKLMILEATHSIM